MLQLINMVTSSPHQTRYSVWNVDAWYPTTLQQLVKFWEDNDTFIKNNMASPGANRVSLIY